MLEPRTLAGSRIRIRTILVVRAIDKDTGIASRNAFAEDRCRDTSLNCNRSIDLNRIVKDDLVRIRRRVVRESQRFCSQGSVDRCAVPETNSHIFVDGVIRYVDSRICSVSVPAPQAGRNGFCSVGIPGHGCRIIVIPDTARRRNRGLTSAFAVGNLPVGTAACLIFSRTGRASVSGTFISGRTVGIRQAIDTGIPMRTVGQTLFSSGTGNTGTGRDAGITAAFFVRRTIRIRQTLPACIGMGIVSKTIGSQSAA